MNRFEQGLPIKEISVLSRGGEVVYGLSRYVSTVYGTPRGYWVALTAYSGVETPMGFCDFVFIRDRKSAILESPISRKRSDLIVPEMDLRARAEDDGIYVSQTFRGKGEGTLLLTTAFGIASNLGAESFIVKHGDKQADWYKQLGGTEILGGFIFNLPKNT